MNKDRRLSIQKVIDNLRVAIAAVETIRQPITDAMEKVKDACNEETVGPIKDDEQESFDNRSESSQQSDDGQASEEAIGNLETAETAIDEVLDELTSQAEDLCSDMTTKLEEAVDALISAQGE